MGGFLDDAPKAENGFVLVRIVSSVAGQRSNSQKTPVISEGASCRSKWSARFRLSCRRRTTQTRHALALNASHAFYVSLLKGAANGGWIPSNRRRFGSDPGHRTQDARNTGRIHVRDGHHDGGKSRNAARCGSGDGPRGSTTHSRQRRRNGAAIKPGLRGRTADVRASDRFASREAARSGLSERKAPQERRQRITA